MKTALLFPGQGSQRVGMGRELVSEFPIAKAVFEEADDALGESISTICFDGPEEALTLTANTQPAILTNSIAILRVLEAERGLEYHIAAGHSLGEWSALVAVGALDFAEAVRLVRLRGQAMQNAVAPGSGAMAAVLGLGIEDVKDLCKEVAHGEVCEPANLNGGKQIVISGSAGAIERAVAIARERGAIKAVPLQVSAPFHCALMKPAADRLAAALVETTVSELRVPVIANFDAWPNSDPKRVKQLLVNQVVGAVRWEESMRCLAEADVTRAFELGSGTVLRGLLRRIDRSIGVSSVCDVKTLNEVEI